MNFVFKLGYCRCRVNLPNFSFRDFTRETKKLADPGGRTRPNGRGPMIFYAKKRYFFLNFFFARD